MASIDKIILNHPDFNELTKHEESKLVIIFMANFTWVILIPF